MSDKSVFFLRLQFASELAPVIPGLHHDFGKPLCLPSHALKLIKYSDTFKSEIAELLRAYPETFNTEVDFDVYPLIVSWFSAGSNQGLVSMIHVASGVQSLNYLARADEEIDAGLNNIFVTGFDLKTLLNKFSERPLSVISTALSGEAQMVAKLSGLPPGDPGQGEALLIAANCAFAATYFI